MRAHLAASAVVTVAVLTVLAHYAVADRAITIRRASPAIAFAPADLRIEVSVPPHPENRAVIVSCEGPQFSRTSGWTIEGANAPIYYRVEWKAVPEGEYDVVASVRSETQERGRAMTRIIRAGAR